MSETENTAYMIDGNDLADKALSFDKIVADALRRQSVIPGLAILSANETDIACEVSDGIRAACDKTGIRCDQVNMFPAPEARVLKREVERLNRDDTIHGIYVQLPSGYTHDEIIAIMDAIDAHKDVNCQSTYGIGAFINEKYEFFNNHSYAPCSTSAVMSAIRSACESVAGLHVVVLGRDSSFVNLLSEEGAVVTVVNPDEAVDIDTYTSMADILIVFIGSPGAITGEMLKPGAIVIDCGYTRNEEGNIVGDVDVESASGVAAAITSVPNGIMPMIYERFVAQTIMMAYEFGKKPFGQSLTPLDYKEIGDYIDDNIEEEAPSGDGDGDEKDLC